MNRPSKSAMTGEHLADLIKRRAIVAIAGDDFLVRRLIFKGGNALVYIHGIPGRASYDLDFSIEGEFEDIEELRVAMNRALRASFEEDKLIPIDIKVESKPKIVSEDLREFWGGYSVAFKLVWSEDYRRYSGNPDTLTRNAIAIGPQGSPAWFQIDISKHEYCGGRQEVLFDGYKLLVYSPMAIVCEKLRAICQQMPEYNQIVKRNHVRRGRAADFLDICRILDRFPIDIRSPNFSDLLTNIFAIKHVPLHFLGLIAGTYEVQTEDFQRLQATVADGLSAEQFANYFQRVVETCSVLEPLWNV